MHLQRSAIKPPPLKSGIMPDRMKGEPLLPQRQKQTYEKFYESTVKNEIFDQKTTVMIQLAASFAIGCYP